MPYTLPEVPVAALAAVPAPRTSRPVGVRTAVTVPLRFADGWSTTARVLTFDGLADGREHLALGLGDWQGRWPAAPPAATRRWCVLTASA